MGNLWLINYLGGAYWAQPNYSREKLMDWTIVMAQDGALINPIRVASNVITFVKTAVQQPPLFGPEPKSFQIGL